METRTPHSAKAYAATYRQALEEAEALIGRLSHEQFNWKPAPDRWSVAECLAHLLAMEPYVQVFEQKLRAGGPAGPPPFRYGFFGRKFIEVTSPEVKRPIKTFAKVNPSTRAEASDFDPAPMLAEFQALTEGFEQVCQQAEGLDLTRMRMASPLVPLVRLQMGAFLEALAGHELRHLAQARQVTQHPGFPKA